MDRMDIARIETVGGTYVVTAIDGGDRLTYSVSSTWAPHGAGKVEKDGFATGYEAICYAARLAEIDVQRENDPAYVFPGEAV